MKLLCNPRSLRCHYNNITVLLGSQLLLPMMVVVGIYTIFNYLPYPPRCINVVTYSFGLRTKKWANPREIHLLKDFDSTYFE